jgi:hypothetical protein
VFNPQEQAQTTEMNCSETGKISNGIFIAGKVCPESVERVVVEISVKRADPVVGDRVDLRSAG